MQTNVEPDNDTQSVMIGQTISVLSHDISTPPKPPPPVLPQKPCLKRTPRKSLDLGIIEYSNKQTNLTEVGRESISSTVSAFGQCHFLSISLLFSSVSLLLSINSFMCFKFFFFYHEELFIVVNCNEISYAL